MTTHVVAVTGPSRPIAGSSAEMQIDEYLRDRLMPVEGAIPHLPGIEMFGDSIPAATAGGDLFEYINFQQRYDIDTRIRRALESSSALLKSIPQTSPVCSSADDYLESLRSRPEYRTEIEAAYREARGFEQARVAENLVALKTTAGVLLVDAQGHGVISAKIASTVHDTFHALMLCDLDRHGTTTPSLFENLNLRLAHSVTARNALGWNEQAAREIATILYGEVHPSGHFRFVSFGHPPPLLYSSRSGRFAEIDRERMVQFLPLGLEVPEDHPDRRRYASMRFRKSLADCSNIVEISLMDAGDFLLLYTDGVHDGSDPDERGELEQLIGAYSSASARDICSAVLSYAVRKDQQRSERGETDLIDDKTAFVIKRSATDLGTA